MATRKLMVLTLIETVLMCEACHHSQYPIADVGLQEDERAQDSKRDSRAVPPGTRILRRNTPTQTGPCPSYTAVIRFIPPR